MQYTLEVCSSRSVQMWEHQQISFPVPPPLSRLYSFCSAPLGAQDTDTPTSISTDICAM